RARRDLHSFPTRRSSDLCNSEAVREYAIRRERLPRARTQVIRNGIDLPEAPAPALEPAWRAPVTAAMIANFMVYKGHATVLHALDRKSTRLNSSHLVISY